MTDKDATQGIVAEVIAAHSGQDGPLLPMLHDIQSALGHVPEIAVPMLADALRTTTAEIYGVLTFYHDFKRAPQGRHVLRLCRAESCQAMGAAANNDAIMQALNLGWHDTTPDGALTLEPVYCLGLCACSPSAMLDERPMGRVRPETIAAAVAGLR
ncbi:formate dehydrogenase subunit gamma [Paracoccus suum]|uniref:Formate dehydrogenase subunit gamma n=1 Tax=Paracoccus suum TaxID=2259340 RepID=A0A344PLB0_9RHOB|nr:formate dehydrogenase subunit gamma [Paracoccus suum]AXC50165.1 formate dehydrogenase subunit gamma [Paracoccus suum]